MADLRNHKVDFLTLGQYLQPSLKHVKITKYYTPQEFSDLGKMGYEAGFRHVESGPLVRSSYRADKLNAIIH
jgi:lipoyl synthase